MKKNRINRWNHWLLEKLVRQENRDSLQQDLQDELDERIQSTSRIRASLWLWRQLLRSILELSHLRWGGLGRLLKHEAHVAFRVFRRQKTFSLINVLGLSIGLACAMIMMLFVYHELSFDRFHANKDRIYRLTYQRERRGQIMTLASAGFNHAEQVRNTLPALESMVLLRQHYQVSTSVGQHQFSVNPLYASEDFFRVFSFSLVKGDEQTALVAPNTVVITPELAEKYFGDADPLGRTIEIERGRTLTVTGLLKPLPQNSHIQADFIASFGSLEDDYKTLINTYLLFKHPIDRAATETQMAEILKTHLRSEKDRYWLLPLTAIHFTPRQGLDIAYPGNPQVCWVLAALALAILATSCINFTNLGMAKSLVRLKEVGLRKVVGAGRGQILRQFLIEGVVHVSVAAVIGYGLMVLALPHVEAWNHFRFASHLRHSPILYGIYLVVIFFTGLASGAYPALAASRFVPLTLLKGQQSKGRTKWRLSQGLMAVQFTVSCALLAFGLVVMSQLHYLMNKDLGFDGDSVISISYFKDEGINTKPEQFKAALQNVVGVEAVSLCCLSPGSDRSTEYGISVVGHPELSTQTLVHDMDEDFFRVFKVPLVQGRAFSPEFTADRENSVLINQSTVAYFDLAEPIGAKLHLDLYNKDVTVVGVVRDFHMESLRRPIRPQVFYNNAWLWGQVVIRLHPRAGQETLDEIQKVWEAMATEEPFSFDRYADKVKMIYRDELRLYQVVRYATLFSALISGLGLFGLSAFMVRRRTKEVGIRKILGASFWDVSQVLSRQFVTVLVVANVLAWPLVLYFMQGWLRQFAYRGDFPLWAPPAVLVASLLAALAIVQLHAWGVVRANPAMTLRHE